MTSDTNFDSEARKISIRTCLAVTFSLAAFMALLTIKPNGFTFLWACPTYLACWLVPSTSIGYDYNRSSSGIWAGIIRGGILCALSILVLALFLPAVQ